LNLFQILGWKHPSVTPESSKVHLPAHNGSEHPLDVFRAGKFKEWQEWQGQKNFARDFIVSLIPLKGLADRWVFAGVYRPLAVRPHPTAKAWLYETSVVEEFSDLSGRLIVTYTRDARATVRLGETVAADLNVVEIRERPMMTDPFISYREVLLSKGELDRLVAHGDTAWVTALSSVKGVYVITDTSNGKLYVGSATSENGEASGGLWSRWCAYSKDGHGGNIELRALLQEKGADHAAHFQYAILEIADLGTSDQAVLDRETHWKRVLASRAFGYNAN
jgi:hypothetical protein